MVKSKLEVAFSVQSCPKTFQYLCLSFLDLSNFRTPCQTIARLVSHRSNTFDVAKPFTPLFPVLNESQEIRSSENLFTPNQIVLAPLLNQINEIRSPIVHKEIIDLPFINKVIENPRDILNEIDEISKRIHDIKLPVKNQTEIHAKKKQTGLIKIRRKKMKKHKRRKTYKKMKYIWAKVGFS